MILRKKKTKDTLMERRETLILWGKESRFLVATNQSKIKLN
jgi:hypothetical protein